MENLNFGQAIEALKQGKRVAREGWNGKGMYLVFINEQATQGNITLRFSEDTEYKSFERLPWIGMKTADNKFVPWLASQTDILAEDWLII